MNTETGFAEMFVDGAMMLAREGARVTKLYMPTRDFLWLAWQCKADDPNAARRPVLRPLRETGITQDWATADPKVQTFRIETVRVGHQFRLAVPWGMVEIHEDKEA